MYTSQGKRRHGVWDVGLLMLLSIRWSSVELGRLRAELALERLSRQVVEFVRAAVYHSAMYI